MSDATLAAALAAERISAGYHRRTVLDDLSVGITRGTVTALVGPNGSGKSTLLKTLARLLQPHTGTVYLDGRAIARMPTATVARMLAVLPRDRPLQPVLRWPNLSSRGVTRTQGRCACSGGRITSRSARR